MNASILTGLALIAAAAATPAQAGEVFGGLYVHGVDTPLILGGCARAGSTSSWAIAAGRSPG